MLSCTNIPLKGLKAIWEKKNRKFHFVYFAYSFQSDAPVGCAPDLHKRVIESN